MIIMIIHVLVLNYCGAILCMCLGPCKSEARSGTLTLPYCNHVVAVDVTASTQLAA